MLYTLPSAVNVTKHHMEQDKARVGMKVCYKGGNGYAYTDLLSRISYLGVYSRSIEIDLKERGLSSVD